MKLRIAFAKANPNFATKHDNDLQNIQNSQW